jgi:hypothetical protein
MRYFQTLYSPFCYLCAGVLESFTESKNKLCTKRKLQSVSVKFTIFRVALWNAFTVDAGAAQDNEEILGTFVSQIFCNWL